MTSTCHPCMHTPQRCAWNSSNESLRSASRHEETLGKAVHDGSSTSIICMLSASGGQTRTNNASELRVHVQASTQWQGLLT